MSEARILECALVYCFHAQFQLQESPLKSPLSSIAIAFCGYLAHSVDPVEDLTLTLVCLLSKLRVTQHTVRMLV